MYRAGNAKNPYGRWFTSEPPASAANVRIDTAVKTYWIDPKTGAYNKRMISKDETLKYRTYGLLNNLNVIENCEAWVYCIESLSGKVMMWSWGADKTIIMHLP